MLLKRYFGIPWVIGIFLASLHIAIMLAITSPRIAWLGAALAIWPALGFFIYTGLSGKGRSPRQMTIPLLLAILGSTVALTQYELWPTLYAALLGIVGILLYDHWYSIMPSPQNNLLKPSEMLPEFHVQGENGSLISSKQWMGRPLLLMFIRGNWCPLCVAQVKELAAEYQRLAEKNVRIVIISAQPLDNSRALAKRFLVPFEFYADAHGKISSALGILHPYGSPLGLPGYHTDTVIPTVVICDTQGKIRYVDIAGNYRDRPEPENIFRELGI